MEKNSRVAELKTRVGLRRYNFLRELTRPIRTLRVREEEIMRTVEGGVFRARVVMPLASELAMMEVVGEISGVVPRNSLAHNLRVIQARFDLDTQELVSTLSSIETKISTQDFGNTLSAVVKEIDESIWAVQDEKRAMETVNKARKIVNKHKNTAIGILYARIEFEEWVERQRPTFFLDQEKDIGDEDDAVVYIDEQTYSVGDHVLKRAAELVCAAFNDLIIAKTPYPECAELLSKRRSLIDAVENIRPKVTAESRRNSAREKSLVGALGGSLSGASLYAVIADDNWIFAAIIISFSTFLFRKFC